MLTKFRKLIEQNELMNKAHNLKMREKQSRAKNKEEECKIYLNM